MKLKKIALKGLIFLFVGVALCMFFGKTVQTITTPKVQFVQAQQGRLEQKINLQAQVHFPKTKDYIVEEAQKSPITVDKVYVKEGHYVEKGETLFTSNMPSYEEDMKKLQDEYQKKAQELIDLDIANRKLSKQSKQNDLYDAMLDAQDILTKEMYDARVTALEKGVTLSGDVTEWSKQLSVLQEVDPAVTKAVQKAAAAKKTFDAARTEFFNTYENKKLRLSADTFKYIKDRNALIDDMDQLNEDMTALDLRHQTLGVVKAPQNGYIVKINVTAGDSYDGSKTAFTMNQEGEGPVLRANLSGETRTFAEGTKVEIPLNEYSSEKTTVQETVTEADGQKYLYIAMPESMQGEGQSSIRRLIQDGGVEATITYRAKKSTTLLPASCVRSEGENQYYIYLVENTYGGLLSSSGKRVIKTNVTVIEKSDKYYSVQEDFSYQEIADREDRALSDKQTVMAYTD